MPIVVYMDTMYSTAEVAKALGVNKRTLLRWLYAGEIPEPERKMGANDSRIWTEEELDNARRYRDQFYRKRR